MPTKKEIVKVLYELRNKEADLIMAISKTKMMIEYLDNRIAEGNYDE